MLLVNPFTGVVINANPEGHNQYFNPDGPAEESLVSKFKKSSKLSRKMEDHYEDPNTGQLKKVSRKPIGIAKISREDLLRLAGDKYGIETDDMVPYGVNPEDTESIRDYVKKYARTYAGHVLE